MTSVRLSDLDPLTAGVDAVVIGSHPAAGDGTGPIAADPAHAAIVAAAALVGATGKAGSVTTVPGAGLVAATRAIVVGLGTPADQPAEALDPVARPVFAERVRRAAGAASRAAAGLDKIVSTLPALDLGAAAEGHLLGGYAFTTYKDPAKAPVGTVHLIAADTPAAQQELARAVAAAGAVAMARDLVNTAPNDLYPAEFAARVTAAAQQSGVEVTVWDEDDLRRDGFGGILAVGSGSTRPPRLIRITHTPSTSHRSIALVGKGITFDSGGLSIKPALGMDQMTADMSGAAAVVATVLAAAALDLPVTVTGWAAMAENLPSGSAYRPGDVIRHYGGTTSHVLNTDAEGRLVLADAIARAVEDGPDALVETSTLTGAQTVALGKRTMGVMGSPALRDRVAAIADSVGEAAWAMPLPEELREGIDSPLADLANVAGNRYGGMLVAGHYLAHFVGGRTPWVHLDVAGPAFHDAGPYGYTGKGGTGVPVRTLLAVLADLADRPA
ncbi:leucyl aminopeptidase [Nakamurella flavida]|uniref:Probable cytosol aminopeptidase n=1 Tax=Nakamurella flavida TaxID=363630 RepID=A0A938YBY1_9ACTN|nr:leucyl aminopeptidase [Nakamurella flavida]MBM9474846.1 leucyl aminopeptidase [Nakamurella flavida]MDP9776416.1 leucyl aminopeptidase [Nakamurella flavida]